MNMKVLSIVLAASLTTVSLAATYPCPYPPNTEKFSAIVLGDMANAAHSVYTGLAVGGEYSNPRSSTESVAVNGKSYVGSVKYPIAINWNKGLVKGADLNDAGIDFSYFEYMTKNVIAGSSGGYKIVRKTTGGTFNTFHFRNGGQGEDNGKTIVFFDTTDDITLTKTNDGRQFGPTIIAPFSHVKVKGDAGYVDGLIVAKKLTTTGNNAGQLQLHGDYFTGPIKCKAPPQSETTAPTSNPTLAPSASPSASPSAIPTISPSDAPSRPPATGTTNGDPHFKTWSGEHFEYHGQCDMVLIKDPEFANGKGIEIQIRTKLVRYWSYIQSVAIRIGSEVLEVEGSDDPSKEFRYWYNFQYQDSIESLGGFPVSFLDRSKFSHYKAGLDIDLGSAFPGERISVATWKEFVRVDVKNASEASFGKSVGMLGEFSTGKTLARDGSEMNDFWRFGQDWQVLPTEPMLFHKTTVPQFPAKCIQPEDPQGQRRRRLEESSVTMEQAESVCASLKDELDRKDCVYDILATQDLEIVGAF